MDVDDLCYKIIGSAMAVHSHFGPGFLEEVYKNALAVELHRLGLYVDKEVPIPIDYQGVRVGNYQADMIVERTVLIELKAVNMLLPRHEAQVVNYLCAARIDDGLLINFGTDSLQYKHKYRHLHQKASISNPDNPVNPVSTLHPDNPVNPVSTLHPDNPVNPVSTLHPVNPVNPVSSPPSC